MDTLIKNLWQPDLFSITIYLILFFSFLKLLLLKKSRGNNLELPPSPPKLPMIGNLHQLGENLPRSLKALSQKHGPLMLLKLGQVKTLIVSSPEILREISESNDVAFSSRPQTLATEALFYGQKNILFAPYGDYWRRARRVCVTELLSLKRVKSFRPVREQETKALLTRIREACCPSGEALMINISEMMNRASNNVMSTCILGQSYREEDGSIEKLGELSGELSALLLAFSVGDFFPALGWIDFVRGFVARVKRGSKAFDEFNERVVEEHKAARELRGARDDDVSHVEDFVDVLLRLQNYSKEIGFELSQDHVKAILQDMLAAGNDTTSVALEWLMAELLRNPRVMKKVQEEVRTIISIEKSKSLLNVDDVNHLVYLKRVVKESLRLHPPAPLLAPRETTEQVEIGGYKIPEKTRVFVNAWAIQRDPSLWDCPEDFIPERFDDDDSNVADSIGKDYKYIPFGFGRRKCPGSALAIVTLEYVIANLLFWFDWKLPDSSPENLDMSEIIGLSVRKRVPLYVVPTPYNP